MARIGVDFEVTADIARCGIDPVKIGGTRFAFVDEPARGISQDRDLRILNGADDACRLLFRRQVEMRMDRGDHDIESR